MLKDSVINEYVKDLSSVKSMPGGGAAAGLTLVQGAALILKVCNLTIGKEKYKMYECNTKEVASKCEFFIKDFYNLIDEDIDKFKNIENVFKMPNVEEDDKRKRSEAMEKACIACIEPPIMMIEKAEEAIKLGMSIIGKSNKSAASDVIVGIELLTAGAISAYQNVLINKNSIKDENALKRCEYAKEMIENIKAVKNPLV